MSAFITPIEIAIISTIVFIVLATMLIRSNRDKIGWGTMLVGAWMFMAGGSALYVAERVTSQQVSYHAMVMFFVISACVTAAGIVTFSLGWCTLTWRYSHRVVERDHIHNRTHASIDLASIDGELRLAVAPSRTWNTGRPRLEVVETDWRNREFPAS